MNGGGGGCVFELESGDNTITSPGDTATSKSTIPVCEDNTGNWLDPFVVTEYENNGVLLTTRKRVFVWAEHAVAAIPTTVPTINRTHTAFPPDRMQ
jgi:hypothetical protein